MSLMTVLAGADTPVGGVINEDTTWMSVDSPYEMIASVIVEEGVTLTIEPNVIVKVAGQYALQVGGGLVARGTETQSIIFTTIDINPEPPDPVPGSWGYIKFEDSSMDAIFEDGEYVSGSILQYCTVEYAGGSGEGAVWIDSASPFIDNCEIRQNAERGFYLYSSASIISNNTISGNSANTYYGGGIYTYYGTVTISNNTISGNSANYGGGIYTDQGTVTISNNTISGNSVNYYYGGGICTDHGTVTISNNTISGNNANSYGGIRASGTVTISNNTISGNTISGSNGAAVYTNSSEPFTNNVIANNKAEGDGDTNAVFIDATPAFNFNSITDNSTEFALYYNLPAGSPDLDATNNWWGTTVDMEIFLMIYDFFDDASKGVVNYFPYLLAPPGAPAAPEYLTITVADSIVTLNWDPNEEPDLDGYKVYYGQNEGGPYDGTGAAEGDSPIDVGDVTTAQLSGLLVNSATYYFVVTAYDDEEPSNESYFSNEVSNNAAPQTPTNQSPADGAEDILLSPTLEADAFFDDDGDGHAASQWQVDVEGGSFSTVYDSGEDAVNLTSITLPIVLEPMAVYKWRVRYMDSRGRWSEYSIPTFFTTGCKLYPTGDVSGNGTVSAYDAALILKYTVGLMDEFPVDLMASPIDSTPRDYTVSVPKQSAKAGDRILMPISIDDATGLLAGGISLKYDPTVLKAVDFTAPSLLNGFYWKANINLIGEIRFAFASAEPAQGKGVLLMVEFEVMPNTEGQTTPLSLAGINLSNSLTINRIDGAVTILPAKTALLPNFPNPFNPETWIPYKLAQPANVAIQIYDVKGRLVRTLNLSNQNAGVYVTKHAAAYWNGRDDAGEKVASGVYFYILQVEHTNKDGASKFRAMRKMAIMK